MNVLSYFCMLSSRMEYLMCDASNKLKYFWRDFGDMDTSTTPLSRCMLHMSNLVFNFNVLEIILVKNKLSLALHLSRAWPLAFEKAWHPRECWVWLVRDDSFWNELEMSMTMAKQRFYYAYLYLPFKWKGRFLGSRKPHSPQNNWKA